jgi:tRNA (guanine10-N2)-dimethyltransferase
MRSLRTLGRLKHRSLVLLSGEGNTIPTAEAKALFLAYDPASEFEQPAPRVLVATSSADPFRIGGRIAFARRVGLLLRDPADGAALLEGRRVRFRAYGPDLREVSADPDAYLKSFKARIDLESPEYELALVRAGPDLLAVTSPGTMRQQWSLRRPRSRPFFHPSAIFPKLSRALVNLSRCKEGTLFLDPLAGTGSIPIEASLIGAEVAAIDLSDQMTRGALSNMRHFGQDWLGVLRADSSEFPLTRADAVATDIPYGRASSTRGRRPSEILDLLLGALAEIMRPSAYAVIMHPQSVGLEGSSDFSLVEEHHLHVHKLLTRTISILRKR